MIFHSYRYVTLVSHLGGYGRELEAGAHTKQDPGQGQFLGSYIDIKYYMRHVSQYQRILTLLTPCDRSMRDDCSPA